MAKTKIAVVGAGIAGLICAYELQKQGHDVTVYEKENYLGGRMSTNFKKGFSFARGANFLVEHYKYTKKYGKELGVRFSHMRHGKHYTFRHNKWNSLGLKPSQLLKFKGLRFINRFKLGYLFLKMSKQIKGLNFFDLSTAVKQDTISAYDYTKNVAGKEVADVVVDAFTSTYQFHRSSEASKGALFGLVNLMALGKEGFVLSKFDSMSALPEAIGKKLNVKKKSTVIFVKKLKKGIVVKTKSTSKVFDKVVMACTANFTKDVYKNPTPNQKKILSAVKYATTINVSFIIPKDLLGKLSILTVPFIESNKIADACNEATKGYIINGKTLINSALHESFAKQIIHKSDSEIFSLVKKELVKVCPNVTDSNIFENHDLQRWNQAMPKYYSGYLKKVVKFLKNGQGDNDIYFCGDFMNAPWIEGSIQCGVRVANKINRN